MTNNLSDETALHWPIVDQFDHGIRPAGKPDHCFYCNQKVGQKHARDCVVVYKKVKVKYTLEIDIEVPHFWHKDMVEFHRGESSWCADNCIRDIKEYLDECEKDDGVGCLCHAFKCDFISEKGGDPYSKIEKAKAELEEKDD